jgi:hypothetical protein
MKLALMMIFALGTSVAFAKDVKDFNKALMDGVKKDLATDNDQNLKKDNSPMRGPASVEVEEAVAPENSKVEKKERQFGNSKW